MTEKFCRKCGSAVSGKYCSNCGVRCLSPLEELRSAEKKAQREFLNTCEKSGLLKSQDALTVARACWNMCERRFHPSVCTYSSDSVYIPSEVFGELNRVRANAYSMFVSMASMVNAMWK